MARPQSNRADYYPHMKEMRNHRKIKALRTKFGALQGYAFWCMMLEWLCGCDGLEWEYNDLESEMFAAELGVSAAEIKDMVEYCLKIELLFKTSDSFIYSESLNEYLAPLFEKRQRERERSNTRKRRENGTFEIEKPRVSAAEMPPEKVSATEIPQSKVEYSKVNKSKVNKSKEEESISANADFEIFWNLYGKKVDREKCLKAFKKLSDTEVLKLKGAVPLYIKSTPDPQFRKNPLTYLNGKCWNDEIIIDFKKNEELKKENEAEIRKFQDYRQRQIQNIYAGVLGGNYPDIEKKFPSKTQPQEIAEYIFEQQQAEKSKPARMKNIV